MAKSFFELQAVHDRARAGIMHTAHGSILTPTFMPVGTQGALKGVLNTQIAATGAGIILANTYHLMLRPGIERLRTMGGLHKFMNYSGALLTDSGGYQVMSLASLRKLDESGVTFRSHIDGSRHVLTPEYAAELQTVIGSDIAMVLDECVAFPATHEQAETAMERSQRWAVRSLQAFGTPPDRVMFPIVQGGIYPDLRQRSAEGLVSLNAAGYAIGGLAVGEPQSAMFEVLEMTEPYLPPDKPRYLMGVGKPDDLRGAVARGIDMFDCVLPTRSGRNGQVFTRAGALNLRNAAYAEDLGPLDPECACQACSRHSRAYLHHLLKAKEINAAVLLTLHNLTYYNDLMTQLRQEILQKGSI